MADVSTKDRKKPWTLIIVSAIVFVLAAAYVVLAAFQSTSTPSGTTTMGVEIGGNVP